MSGVCTRMGTVTAVNSANPRSAVITLEGTTGIEMRALEHVWLAVGKYVYVLDSGSGDMLIIGNVDNGPGAYVFAGVVWDWVGTTAPAGWALLDGSTITNCQTLYPDLWAAAPAGWRSGANLILPNGKGRSSVMYDSGNAFVSTMGALVGAADSATIAHTHAHSLGSAGESTAHVHYLGAGSGYVNGWTATGYTGGRDTAHTHGLGTTGSFVTNSAGGSAYMAGSGAYGPFNIYGNTSTESADHGHGLGGYSSGNHLNHTHSITGTVDAATGTVSATNRNYHPALVLNKIIKL